MIKRVLAFYAWFHFANAQVAKLTPTCNHCTSHQIASAYPLDEGRAPRAALVVSQVFVVDL